jgi:hypothetical protein
MNSNLNGPAAPLTFSSSHFVTCGESIPALTVSLITMQPT